MNTNWPLIFLEKQDVLSLIYMRFSIFGFWLNLNAICFISHMHEYSINTNLAVGGLLPSNDVGHGSGKILVHKNVSATSNYDVSYIHTYYIYIYIYIYISYALQAFQYLCETVQAKYTFNYICHQRQVLCV